MRLCFTFYVVCPCIAQAEAAAASSAPKDGASLIDDDGFIVMDDVEVSVAAEDSSRGVVRSGSASCVLKRGIDDVHIAEGGAAKKHKEN